MDFDGVILETNQHIGVALHFLSYDFVSIHIVQFSIEGDNFSDHFRERKNSSLLRALSVPEIVSHSSENLVFP